MSYTITEVDGLPEDGRASRVSTSFYNDIIKDFRQRQITYGRVDVEDKNPDTVHRRLLSRTETWGVSVFHRQGGVYLLNQALEAHNEQNDNPPKEGW